jgi:DNA repair protein RadC
MHLARSLTHTHYKLSGETTEQDVLAAAEGILRTKLERQGSVGNPTDANDFLRMRLGALSHEEFHVLWLDNRHRIIDCQKLFTGTVDGASIHPREVVRAALNVNACAAILRTTIQAALLSPVPRIAPLPMSFAKRCV